MGAETWHQWVDLLATKGRLDSVITEPSSRRFRFDSGLLLTGKFQATFDVKVFGSAQKLTVHVVPGSTPMFIARPDVEA